MGWEKPQPAEKRDGPLLARVPTCYRKQRSGLDSQDGDTVSFAQVSGKFQPAGSDCRVWSFEPQR